MFVDHHLQQIIDALRLELFDLECPIDSEDAKRFLGIEVKSAQLYPAEKGREKQDQKKKVDQTPHLAFEQRLGIDGLSAHVVQVAELN